MSIESAGQVVIATEGDIVAARQTVRALASEIGFNATDVTRIVTAASELARNIFQYAGKGAMHWRRVQKEGHSGLELKFQDDGPGIPDTDLAMEEGYSSGRGLGLGLPGARRLMDEMEIQSHSGRGTTVIVRKWRKQQPY
jgi:serine/threonine-protein kinase RsbT